VSGAIWFRGKLLRCSAEPRIHRGAANGHDSTDSGRKAISVARQGRNDHRLVTKSNNGDLALADILIDKSFGGILDLLQFRNGPTWFFFHAAGIVDQQANFYWLSGWRGRSDRERRN